MIYNDNVNTKEVPHWHTGNTHKTQGVTITPDDNNSQQVDRMRKLVL